MRIKVHLLEPLPRSDQLTVGVLRVLCCQPGALWEGLFLLTSFTAMNHSSFSPDVQENWPNSGADLPWQ